MERGWDTAGLWLFLFFAAISALCAVIDCCSYDDEDDYGEDAPDAVPAAEEAREPCLHCGN